MNIKYSHNFTNHLYYDLPFNLDYEVEYSEEWNVDIDDLILPDEFFDNAIILFDGLDDLWILFDEFEKEHNLDEYYYDIKENVDLARTTSRLSYAHEYD